MNKLPGSPSQLPANPKKTKREQTPAGTVPIKN